jgi:hypothetical protein
MGLFQVGKCQCAAASGGATSLVHQSTTSCTTLPGCWARLRVGLPSPCRSGLLDGKCVWRLRRHISLSPLCIACLDPTRTTSGWTMWPAKSCQSTTAPSDPRPYFCFFCDRLHSAKVSERRLENQRQPPVNEWNGQLKSLSASLCFVYQFLS